LTLYTHHWGMGKKDKTAKLTFRHGNGRAAGKNWEKSGKQQLETTSRGCNLQNLAFFLITILYKTAYQRSLSLAIHIFHDNYRPFIAEDLFAMLEPYFICSINIINIVRIIKS
jgi:hypothetical protein